MPQIRNIAEDVLHKLATRALQSYGLAANDAADAARVLVLADLFGVSTHGVMRVQSYGERLEIGGIDPKADVKVERKSSAIAMVDGANGVGTLVGMRALAAAIEGARETGVGVAFARHSNHFGPIASYAWIAQEQGFASIIGSNASLTIAPTGGSDTRLGNNPLGLCVPNPSGDPVMLDMAMSVVARAKIRQALARGESIPDTWATDAEGRTTTDPKTALDGILLPVGGYKGYGLALMVDMFAGLLSGAAYLSHVKSWVDEPDVPQNLGHFFILIDTARLGLPDLAARVTDFAAILHASPPVDPAVPVQLPGEREIRRMKAQRRDGIELDAKVLAFVEERAGRVPA
jgi:LDH2 family malate/lactate/ureidoglycolate dehydrogenase